MNLDYETYLTLVRSQTVYTQAKYARFHCLNLPRFAWCFKIFNSVRRHINEFADHSCSGLLLRILGANTLVHFKLQNYEASTAHVKKSGGLLQISI